MDSPTLSPPSVTTLPSCIDPHRYPARIEAGSRPGAVSESTHAQVLRVIERCWQDIAGRMAGEPQAFRGQGRRTVRLWQSLTLSVSEAGTNFHAQVCGSSAPLGLPRFSADLRNPISPYAFTTAFGPTIAKACTDLGLDPRSLPVPALKYMRSVFARTFRAYVDWNRLRRSVLAALAPDPLVVSLTRRTFEDGTADLADFNWVAGRARELALVATERPRLLPFLQLARDLQGSPVENFDALMSKAGLHPTARHKLEQWGFEAFSHLTENSTHENLTDTIVRFANLLDRVGVDDEPSPMFAELVMHTLHAKAPDWYLRALWHEVCAIDEEDPDELYLPDFEVTHEWLGSGPPEPDDNQKKAGWSWIVARAWEHRLARDDLAKKPWRAPSGEFCSGGLTAVPIGNAAALREEALVMHNCLTGYEGECRSGRIAVYSIRRDGRRVACLALSWVPKGALWKVVQVAGRANAEVTPEVRAFAKRVADHCSEQIPF